MNAFSFILDPSNLSFWPVAFSDGDQVIWSDCNSNRPFRSNSWQIFFKIDNLKSFAIFTGKHLHYSLFKMGKKDSNTDVFLWILWDFEEHLFWKTSANGCFWNTPRAVTRILRKIWDGEPCSNSERLKAVNHCSKALHLGYL